MKHISYINGTTSHVIYCLRRSSLIQPNVDFVDSYISTLLVKLSLATHFNGIGCEFAIE